MGDIVCCCYRVDESERDKHDTSAVHAPSSVALAWLRCRKPSDVLNAVDLSDAKKKLLELFDVAFKLDPFGNLICPLAKNLTLLHADIDHIFPIALGGRTSHSSDCRLFECNVVMLHDKANRVVKNDTPIQFVHPVAMQTGVTVGAALAQLCAKPKATPLLPVWLGFDPLVANDANNAVAKWNKEAVLKKTLASDKRELESGETVMNALRTLARKELESMK